MRRLVGLLAVASCMTFISCNESRREQEGQDSKEVAEEANEEKFDDNDMQKDADFIAEMVAGNYAEIKMAQVAKERSSNPQIKEIATMLEKDHNQLLTELKTLAQAKAITVPMEEDQDAKDKLQNLRSEKPEDFNNKWLEQMKDKHDKSVDKFEQRANNSEDAEIKAFASKTLPHLKMHLEKIRTLQDQMKNADRGNS